MIECKRYYFLIRYFNFAYILICLAQPNNYDTWVLIEYAALCIDIKYCTGFIGIYVHVQLIEIWWYSVLFIDFFCLFVDLPVSQTAVTDVK